MSIVISNIYLTDIQNIDCQPSIHNLKIVNGKWKAS